MIDFQTDPGRYRHWRVEYAAPAACLYMDVDEHGGLFEGYQLKLNSYDLGVDIELADIVQRMRFEHPEIGAVVLLSGKPGVFCAGANIRMLAAAEPAHKVNFCKFTNETRNTFEAAGRESGQTYICAIKGACAGGGYELALACDYIILADDAASSVALPEVPLLAVLPGTGGLTRLTDKRKVRRDLADVFCSTEEGVKGARAQAWRLVDAVVPNSQFDAAVAAQVEAVCARSQRRSGASDAASDGASDAAGIRLTPLERRFDDDGAVAYSRVKITPDRARRIATVTLFGPDEAAPTSMQAFHRRGDQAYLLRLARELDDAILHLRLNETEIGTLIFTTSGDPALLAAHERQLFEGADHWLAHEVILYWKRVLKRLDLTSRSLVALVEHGSCFVGLLAELLFAVDRSCMMAGEFEQDSRPAAAITLTAANFGALPMSNDLTRLQTRFLADPGLVERLAARPGDALPADAAMELGLVTYAYDDIDWQDEIRLFLEARVNFSPDALTGMEANLRFAGPETMETRIFGRLTAWQNWIFQRPNAAGKDGALQRYGSGLRAAYDRRRV